MKKIVSLVIGFLMIFLVAGCGENSTPAGQPPETNIQKNDADKILVVYFSVPETTTAENRTPDERNSTVVIKGEVLGNTQYVAQVIQENTDADIFRIEPVNPYPMNHADIEHIATREKQNNELPQIAEKIQDFDSYTIFFVGYPNWYGDMPRILYSFFNEYDFGGKTIVPFVTSGGAGFSNSINEIKHIQPNANVIESGLALTRDVVPNSENDIENWLKTLGF